jgi:putative glutamine amidotransferase
VKGVIAVSCDRTPGVPAPGPNADSRVRPTPPRVIVSEAVIDGLRDSDMEAVLLPPAPQNIDKYVEWVMSRCDGVVITGGAFDIHPENYGHEVSARIDRVDEGRTNLELALARAAIDRNVPILGICGGMQALVVAGGGTLHQDISKCISGALQHEQPTDPSKSWHPVSLAPTVLRKAFGTAMIRVNSTHHQAVDDPGALEVAGRAPDGVIEAVVHPDHKCCVGVQWHPEYLDFAPFRLLAYFSRR